MISNNFINGLKNLLFNIEESKKEREYILSRISLESINEFSFGYLPDPSNFSLLFSFINKKDIIDTKVFYDKFIKELPPRIEKGSILKNYTLTVPYYDLYNNPVALVGRTLLDYNALEIPKYKNTSFQKTKHLFGLNKSKYEILKNDKVFIVEGQLDMIKMWEKGIKNVVAVGSSSLTSYQLGLILRLTKNACLTFDNDVAGTEGALRAQEKFISSGANFTRATFPNGYKDPFEFFESNSKEDFLEFNKL